MTLSPDQLGQISQYLGAIGVLAVVVVAFMRDWIMTKPTADRLVALSVSTQAKENERLKAENAELRRTNDLLREVTQRNSGSQGVQATVVADAMESMTRLADQLVQNLVANGAALPALPAPPGTASP